ncbi:MAG: hypothetical protein IKN88_04165 [Bacteroidales bacterium]|jgi:hypothetical protein|nr:hypothetical protein [Bacteroidales bacterium]MBO7584834.1 hypothetical protein [Bacteroidales bacterium]MBP5317423.1 hypothetical protein [Bacteroidales bacterium]MBR3526951.1 hypothetical protein [Bacteroidales bacterium]
MKKAIFALLVLACIAGMTSCTKKCYCKATLNGEELAGKTIDNDSGKACSTYNYKATVLGQAVEFKCTMSL